MSLDTRLTDLAEEIGADVKALREGKANTAHDHDDRYYTKSEIDQMGRNIDGGSAGSVYLPSQVIDGGSASG